jgi:hypothetical protein
MARNTPILDAEIGIIFTECILFYQLKYGRSAVQASCHQCSQQEVVE